jgi:transposase
MKLLLNVANSVLELCFDWISTTYDGIVRRGLIYHEALLPMGAKNRGKQKRRPGHNLLIRLKNFKADVLRFRSDEEIPFTNNLAERDVRMMKVKQKISGGFRTEDEAIVFCRIRGFISTVRKQGRNILDSIDAVLSRQTYNLFPT